MKSDWMQPQESGAKIYRELKRIADALDKLVERQEQQGETSDEQ